MAGGARPGRRAAAEPAGPPRPRLLAVRGHQWPPYWAVVRLFGIAVWKRELGTRNAIDGRLAFSGAGSGGLEELATVRQVCNVVYTYLAEGLDSEGLKGLDRDLSVDPQLVAKYGQPSRGSSDLMKMLGGGRPPARKSS